MKQAIEELLHSTDTTNYQISKATGISQPVLSKYTNGKSDIENMTFGNALKLYEYHLNLKGGNDMQITEYTVLERYNQFGDPVYKIKLGENLFYTRYEDDEIKTTNDIGYANTYLKKEVAEEDVLFLTRFYGTDGKLKKSRKFERLYKKLVEEIGYDGKTDESIEFYNNIDDFRFSTMFDTHKEFKKYVEEKFNVDATELDRPIIVLDKIGSVDGTIYTSDDDFKQIESEVKEFFE